MNEIDPDKAVEAVSDEMSKRSNRASRAFEWLKETDGLVQRSELVTELASDMGWSESVSNIAIADLVGDMVDPVQQLETKTFLCEEHVSCSDAC